MQNIGAGTVQVRTIGECERECDGLREKLAAAHREIALLQKVVAMKGFAPTQF